MKATRYFLHTPCRPDRVIIADEWIVRVIQHALREERQSDGRIRRWGRILELDNRALRVILLDDGETVHNAFIDRDFQERGMRVKYFADTDTALVEFADGPPVETRALDENIYVDLDVDGHIISLTIQHAQQTAGMDEFSYQRLPAAVGT